MKRSTFRLSVLTLTVSALAGACTLITEVDRSKIVEEPPPEGMGGDKGTGGEEMGGGPSSGGSEMGGEGGEGGAGGAN